MEIGVIGVGRMGSAMARNLIKAGHSEYLFDAVPDGPRALEKEGGNVVASASDLKAAVSAAGSRPLLVLVRRGDKSLYLTISPRQTE